MLMKCTFANTGTYTFTYRDEAGNTGSNTATVTRIDRIPPTCDVQYSTTSPTNQSVVATLTGCSKAVRVDGNSIFYTFENNGNYTFTFTDYAGNTGSTPASVNRIDKIKPEITNLTYVPSTPTNQNVTVTFTASEPIFRPAGRSGADTGTVFSRIFEANT